MRTAILILVAVAAVMTTVEAERLANQQKKARHYTAPDGGLSVVVVPASKVAGRADYESRIDFNSSEGNIACTLDYSSEDNEHGFHVAKAEWTPDSQYFVFSLTSSGGHQTWHTPTQFLSRKDGTVRALDDYFAPGISRADFRLIAPNTVKTEVWRQDTSIPVSVDLAALPPLRSPKPLLINCVGGRVFKQP